MGASISCAANGTQWLHEWGVDVKSGRPIELMKLVMRDWKTGEILNQYSLEDYEATWGNVSAYVGVETACGEPTGGRY